MSREEAGMAALTGGIPTSIDTVSRLRVVCLGDSDEQ